MVNFLVRSSLLITKGLREFYNYNYFKTATNIIYL
jgi:hypothetical protein